MRLTSLILSSPVKKVLALKAHELRITDVEFLFDIYALFRTKGNCLLTKEKLEQVAAEIAKATNSNPVLVKVMASKRNQVLGNIVKNSYFQALLNLNLSPIKMAERMYKSFKLLYLKKRQAQCVSCPHMPSCDFGKQYGDKVTDIITVVDPDYQLMVNPLCPWKPIIDSTNLIATSLATVNQMAANAEVSEVAKIGDKKGVDDLVEAEHDAANAAQNLETDDAQDAPKKDDMYVENAYDNDDDVERTTMLMMDDNYYCQRQTSGTAFNGTFTGKDYVAYFEKLVGEMTVEQLQVFDIGNQIGEVMKADTKGEFAPTTEEADDKTSSHTGKIVDTPKLVSSSHGLPEEIFDKRAERGELEKRENLQKFSRSKLVYLLIDSSGSMDAHLKGGNKRGLMKRSTLATVFSMAIAKKLKDEKGICFLRFFSYTPGPLIAARNQDEFDHVLHMLKNANYGDGGTSITNALARVIEDIHTANQTDLISKSHIFLITDADDYVDSNAVKAALKGIKLSTLDVSCRKGTRHGAAAALKSISDKYMAIDPNSLSVKDMVSLVK